MPEIGSGTQGTVGEQGLGPTQKPSGIWFCLKTDARALITTLVCHALHLNDELYFKFFSRISPLGNTMISKAIEGKGESYI